MRIILYLLSILLPHLSSLSLEIFLDETKSLKSLFLGYRDNVVFFFHQSKIRVNWMLNDDKIGIDSNVYPATESLIVEKSFNLSCRPPDPSLNLIIVKVFVVGEKILADTSNIWANRGEMITITNVPSCEKYLLNYVDSVISSSPFESIYHHSPSSSLRITQMSERMLGKYMCDSKLINIVGIKKVVEVEKTEDVRDIKIFFELQSLKVKYPKTYIAGEEWILSENSAVNRVSWRKLMGNDLMIEGNSPYTRLTIRLVSTHESWEVNVLFLTICPSIRVSPLIEVIQDQRINVTCSKPPQLSGVPIASKLKLALFNTVLHTSSNLHFYHQIIPDCNSGLCFFKCIHEFYFAGNTYQFSNSASLRYYQKVQLTDGDDYYGVDTEAVALRVTGKNDSSQYRFCNNQNEPFTVDSLIDEFTLILLSRTAHNGMVYIVPYISPCDIKVKISSFTFLISPAVSVIPSENGIVSPITLPDNKVLPVTLIIDPISSNMITAHVNKKNVSVPSSGIVQLIPEEYLPSYSLLQYSLFVKPIGSAHGSLEEIHKHQIEVIPYSMLNWSTTAINLYHGEFVSICATHMTENEVCAVRRKNSIILPSESLSAKIIGNCVYLNVLNSDKDLNLTCSTYSQVLRRFPYAQRFSILPPSFTPLFTTFSNSTFVEPVCILQMTSKSSEMQIIDIAVYPFRLKSLFGTNYKHPKLSKPFFITTPPEELVCKITFRPHLQSAPRVVYLKKTFFHKEHYHSLYVNQEFYHLGCFNCKENYENITWTVEIGEKTDELTWKFPILFISIEKSPYLAIYKCYCSNFTYFEQVVHVINFRPIPVSINIQTSINWIDIDTIFTLTCSVQFTQPTIDSGNIVLFEDKRQMCEQNADCPRKEISFEYQQIDQIDVSLDLSIPVSETRKFRCIVTLDGRDFEASKELTIYNTMKLSINDDLEVVHYVAGRTQILTCSFNDEPPESRTFKIWWASPDGSEIVSTTTLHELKLNLLVTDNVAGIYVCNARLENRTSIVSRSVEIIVHHNQISPVLKTKVDSSFSKVRTTEYMILTCIVENHIFADPGTLTITNGLSNCTVTGRCINMDYREGKNTLILNITHPDESLDSSLFCRASNSNLNTRKVFNIQFALKPDVKLKFVRDILPRIGEEIEIECCVSMGEYPIPKTTLEWMFNISSNTSVSHSSPSEQCSKTTISHLDWVHSGYYECRTEVYSYVIKNWTDINPLGVRLENEPYSIGPNTIVPLDSLLKLVCSVRITDKSTILWSINDVLIDKIFCKNELNQSHPTVSTLTCDVRLGTLGPLTACCFTSSQKNPKLITYQMSVVPKPSVETFINSTDDDASSSSQSKTVLICNAMGYVTNMVIYLIVNQNTNAVASKEIEILDDNYSRIHSLEYHIPNQDLNNKSISYRCDAIAKSSMLMTQDYVSSVPVVLNSNATQKINIPFAVSLSLAVLAILVIAFFILFRSRINLQNGINLESGIVEPAKTSS